MYISLIAAVYIGFAVADGRPKVLAVEVAVASTFVLIAAVAVTATAWLLVLGYAGHGLKDYWQHRRQFVVNTRWWPPFCAAVDHDFSTDVVVVVGPALRSGMTARRLLPMVGDRRVTIVGNRFRDEPDHPGLEPAVRVPSDPDLTQAEREGRSPFDACPGSPAVAAVARLADLLLSRA